MGAPKMVELPSKGSVLVPRCQMPARAPRNSHLQNKSAFAGLYKWQREYLNGPDFILHDGPPYANGEPHMGHAINKIIKDIINRNHVMNGQRVHYIPGWDCHGLPIELKALNSKKLNTKTLKPTELREIARSFALETIKKQKSAFESWGVMADWDDQCYYTLDKKYVQHQMRRFYELYENKFVYKDVKPVYWSPSSGTALAEAELEYDQNHKSTQVYLALKLDRVPEELKNIALNDTFSAVIWSTTPWSLVGNQAICYAENLQYSLLRDSSDQSVLIVATSLVSQLEKICNKTFTEIYKFQGNVLSLATYHHPLKENVILPFYSADHVSSQKGTGLVHTAPAHGPEDFLVALKNNIKIESYVNERGNFENFANWLDGSSALGSGQNKIIEMLQSQILFSGPFIHSYPLDWRTKKPVILRASSQWFIDTNALRSKTLSALENVKILPAINGDNYKRNFVRQLQTRPYWCISRQRLWGTPIPVVYLKEKPLINKDLVNNICKIIERDGTDSWWLTSMEDIVPESLLKENNCTSDQLTKGKDIMDIWLDSGLSWSNVLNSKTADVYLEGLDQFTGWFQSSLVTSVALIGNAPYKNIYVHGFAVDSNGIKMSKSLGNVISPETIISGGKNQQKDPAYGVDTLRWWVARHGTQDTKVEVSKNMLSESHSEVVKLRLLLKFLLGCIYDLKPSMLDAVQPTGYLNWYMLHLLHALETEIKGNYDLMNYSRICLDFIHFTSNHVSGTYSHAVKDRLYCDAEDSPRRRSSQIVIHHVLMSMLRCLGPILPHLVEEAWSHHPLNVDNVPFFQMTQDQVKPIWERVYVESLMDTVLEIKTDVNKLCLGRSTLEYAAIVTANPETFDKFMLIQNSDSAVVGDLCDVLYVSRVDLVEAEVYEDEWSVSVVEIDKKLCKRCRRFTSDDESKPCSRCHDVLSGVI